LGNDATTKVSLSSISTAGLEQQSKRRRDGEREREEKLEI
jgi:hypothetical protein